MDEQSVNANSKIDYVKPMLLDLGAVTAAYGVSGCSPDGFTATLQCEVGTTAGTNCADGETARSGACSYGDNPRT